MRDNALTALKNLPAKIVTNVLEEMSTRELGDPAMTWVDNFLALAVEHSLEHLDNLVVYPHVSSQALEALFLNSLTSLDLLAMDFSTARSDARVGCFCCMVSECNAALKAKVEEWAERQGISMSLLCSAARCRVRQALLNLKRDRDLVDEEETDDDALPEEAKPF